MAETINQHYDELMKHLNGNKDSIFEPCRVLEFDSRTLQATVYGTRSKETKENVIVMFPSFYLNSGIITFPVPESFGIVFVGPDNENYMLPAQFFIPTKTSRNNMAQINAAPSQFDHILSLENMEPGEVLLRSLNQAHVFISNSGEIELLTKKLHRLSLNEVDGSLEQVIERERKQMGYSNWYNGAHEAAAGHEDLYEQHIHATIHEEIPNLEQEIPYEKALELIQKDKDLKGELQIGASKLPKYYMQKVNVYDEEERGEFLSTKQRSNVDGEELFSKEELYGGAGNEKKRVTKEVSKEGAIEITHSKEEEGKRYNLKTNYDKVELVVESGNEKSGFEMKSSEIILYQQNVNGHRISLRLSNGGLRLYIDGIEVDFYNGAINIVYGDTSFRFRHGEVIMTSSDASMSVRNGNAEMKANNASMNVVNGNVQINAGESSVSVSGGNVQINAGESSVSVSGGNTKLTRGQSEVNVTNDNVSVKSRGTGLTITDNDVLVSLDKQHSLKNIINRVNFLSSPYDIPEV